MLLALQLVQQAAVKQRQLLFQLIQAKLTANGSNLQWYYADEKEFVIDGIKVFVDGKEVDAEDLITFDTTPEQHTMARHLIM